MSTQILASLEPISESPIGSKPSIKSDSPLQSQGTLKLAQSPKYENEIPNNDDATSLTTENNQNQKSPSKTHKEESIIREEQLLLTDPELEKEIQNQKSSYDNQEILRVDQVPPQLLAKNLQGPVKMEDHFLASYKGVNNNILNALTFLHKPSKNGKDGKYIKERVESWKEKLKSEENQLIINDGFWLVLLKKNRGKFVDEEEVKNLNKKLSVQKKKRKIRVLGYVREENSQKLTKGEQLYNDIENSILDRMAVIYINLLDRFEGKENEKFFEVIF